MASGRLISGSNAMNEKLHETLPCIAGHLDWPLAPALSSHTTQKGGLGPRKLSMTSVLPPVTAGDSSRCKGCFPFSIRRTTCRANGRPTILPEAWGSARQSSCFTKHKNGFPETSFACAFPDSALARHYRVIRRTFARMRQTPTAVERLRQEDNWPNDIVDSLKTLGAGRVALSVRIARAGRDPPLAKDPPCVVDPPLSSWITFRTPASSRAK